jgi:hypothetical protein
MALTKTASTSTNNQTVAANSEYAVASASAVDLSEALQAEVTCEVTYHASATAGATIRVYTSRDNTNWDTNPAEEIDMPFTAGATVRFSAAIQAAAKYVKATIKNLDAAQALTAGSTYVTVQA